VTVENTPPSSTSMVTASAYVDQQIATPIVVLPKSAQSISTWGAVSVGIAFSNQLTPMSIEVSPKSAYSTVSGGVSSGRNLLPVSATAVVQQSNTVTPPTPPGAQLSFYWG
jgi:hypothetical protein